MTKQLLSVQDFARLLLAANDLDPVYTVLLEARKHKELVGPKLHEWLLAYWCFYDSGTASRIVDTSDYWKTMRLAAGSNDWKRAKERRHFRGENARKSVEWLWGQGGVEKLFAPLRPTRPVTVKTITDYIQTWVGFGPWIAFKAADMLERLGLTEIRFTGDLSIMMFDSPRKGAAELWYVETDEPPSLRPSKNVEEWAVETILGHLGSLYGSPEAPSLPLAPPRFERVLGIQEVETILCKWHSYRGGHYRIGEDVEALEKSLSRVASESPTAKTLLESGRRAKLWT